MEYPALTTFPASSILSSSGQLADFLEFKYKQYSQSFFIEADPIAIPHRFTLKQDIEISGFLAATLAWGQRPVIIRNAAKLIEWMDEDPFHFIRGFTPSDLGKFRKFCHRTFNGNDCCYFLTALKALYQEKESMEEYFKSDLNVAKQGIEHKISAFRNRFFSFSPEMRNQKHFADPMSGSACKRFNMFLRWMVRKDASGIDFGIWKSVHPSELMLPLDIHSGRVARALGILTRKQNDWKAVTEVTANLKKLDPADPVKYDYALFGTGVFEKIN